MSVEDILNGLYISGIAHEGVSDEVDVELDGKFDVAAVLCRECRQVDVLTWHVHALVRTECTLVLHLSHEHRSLHLHDLHVELTVIKQDVIAHLYIGSNIRIAQVHDVVRRLHLWATEDFHHVTSMIQYRLLHVGGAHLWSLGINHDTDVWRYGSNVLYNVTDTFLCGMCGVHTNHVHASKKEFADEILIASTIADGSDNLCLFHICINLIEISIIFVTFLSLFSNFVQRYKENLKYDSSELQNIYKMLR